jgi:hypothetical protein
MPSSPKISSARWPELVRRDPKNCVSSGSRQLLIEKKAADAELEQLTLKRTQLETALSAAEVQAYQESAAGPGFENSLRAVSITPTLLLALGLLAILVIVVVACVSVLLRMQAIERALR